MSTAVYEAESQLARLLDRADRFPTVTIAGSTLTLPPERRFNGIDEVQAYVDEVLALPAVRARWPRAAARPVRVRARRGPGRAHYEFDGAVMAIPVTGAASEWARRELVVLHEIAHHLGATVPAPDGMHGRAFRARLIDLVTVVLGPETGFALRVLLADQGVVPGAPDEMGR